nr:MAG TPA: hypothetical protein [Caudoviricetes sp.]
MSAAKPVFPKPALTTGKGSSAVWKPLISKR